MRVRAGRILVVDLELTMPGDGLAPGFIPEIVEIGVAELLLSDVTPRLGRLASWLARPRKGSVTTDFTALTGISEAELRRAPPLGQVLSSCAKMFGRSGHAWAAWGGDDQPLAEACQMAGQPPLFGGPFYDIGFLYGAFHGGRAGVGLRQAMQEIDLKFEGRQHRAGPDAMNAARVLGAMIEHARTMSSAEIRPGRGI